MAKTMAKMKGGNLAAASAAATAATTEIKTVYFYSFIVILILAFIIVILIGHLFFTTKTTMPVVLQGGSTTTNIKEMSSSSLPPIDDPYYPPLKNDGTFFPNRSINIRTRGDNFSDFTQIGILTRHGVTEPKILPLMGRHIMNGRNKFQYYTISNTGFVNTKLPVRKDGRNCINEYGCDELYNGDSVFVEGYDDKFKVTVYENFLFRYIP